VFPPVPPTAPLMGELAVVATAADNGV